MDYNFYTLENDLANGCIVDFDDNIDSNNLTTALQILTDKLKEIDCQTASNQADNLGASTHIHNLENELHECKTIIRKMGKDYPELVLSYPKFFTKGEENAHN